eukprot:1150741-Pelagomonas_calceolata.AAC.1
MHGIYGQLDVQVHAQALTVNTWFTCSLFGGSLVETSYESVRIRASKACTMSCTRGLFNNNRAKMSSVLWAVQQCFSFGMRILGRAGCFYSCLYGGVTVAT